MAKSTPEPSGHLFGVRAFYMLVQHRFEVELFIAVEAGDGRVVVMVLHVLRDHLLRIELSLAEIALEVRGPVDFLVLREIARIAERFIAESALVQCQLRVFA